MQPDAQKVAATNVFARSGKGTRVCASPVLLFCLRGEPLGVAVVERRVEMVPFPDGPDRFPSGKRVQNRPNPSTFPRQKKVSAAVTSKQIISKLICLHNQIL